MKLYSKLLSGFLTVALASGVCTFEIPQATAASNAVALVDEMGMGWNLGNTFDSGACAGWVSNDPYVDTEVGWGNSKTTSAMINAGADQGATGENPVIVQCRTADIIAGPIGVTLADAMLGEVSPRMAAAVGQSAALRVLLPSDRCNTFIAGVAPGMTRRQLIDAAVERILLAASESE